MRWEDERYVRLYTRDTATWSLLPWQARCLLPLLIRKLDRAGVLDVMEGEEAQALSVMLGMPAEVIEVGLAALIGRRVFVLEAGRMLMPNFMEAQECSQSDKVRKQISREKASKPTSLSQLVTDGHKLSQTVTDGHSSSQMVTPSRAVPCRAEPSVLSLKEVPAKKPRAPSKPSVQQAWFALAQTKRVARRAGITPEEPDTVVINSALKAPLAAIGAVGLSLAWDAFLDDPWAADKGWPFNAFIAQWPALHAKALAATTQRSAWSDTGPITATVGAL